MFHMLHCFLCSEYFHPTLLPSSQRHLSNSYSRKIFPDQNKIQTPFQGLQRPFVIFSNLVSLHRFPFYQALPVTAFFSPIQVANQMCLIRDHPSPQAFSYHIALFYPLHSTSIPEILVYSFMSLLSWLPPPDCKFFEVGLCLLAYHEPGRQ